ncbi:MAG: HAMP domain-containing histidine kinase [Xanthomonadaceae bacterium]|nr:HAMP domain-containing histidine kinase [Xanthomonadaceae bacterium]MDE2225019.1 HAMP domain-containing histidine kinase [Xanthomonadaceae bacterium]
MARYTSIGHRFWVMFSLWVAAISVVTALGVYAAANSSRTAIARQELDRESIYYGQQLVRNPQTPLPDTWLLRGYLRAPGAPADVVPARLVNLTPGYHQIAQPDGTEGTVLVSDTPRGRLFLLFNNDRPNSVVMLFGLIPVVLVVLIIYLATWLTYRASRKALSPVIALAKVVRRWNPDHPDPASLAPDRLPAASDSDVEVLVAALYNFANRLDAFVERERNFTRDASHELRTPLTVMKIAVDVLADEDMSPFAQRSLARIRRSVREMEALIETFLVLARESDAGLRDEDFLANDVVAAEVTRYRELLAGKPVQLVMVEHARFALHAPPRVFAVMIGNLIRNACLYTEQGSVTVEVEANDVRVADTGSGMSEEDLERAFQPFYRGSRTGRRGHGIGLAIVRRIADRYHWQVTLESALGKGTTATAHFPAAQPPDAALPGPVAAREQMTHDETAR